MAIQSGKVCAIKINRSEIIFIGRPVEQVERAGYMGGGGVGRRAMDSCFFLLSYTGAVSATAAAAAVWSTSADYIVARRFNKIK